MKTNKDLIFVLIVWLWILSNLSSFALWQSSGVLISNFVWILITATMVLIKQRSDSFEFWLDKKIPSKN